MQKMERGEVCATPPPPYEFVSERSSMSLSQLPDIHTATNVPAPQRSSSLSSLPANTSESISLMNGGSVSMASPFERPQLNCLVATLSADSNAHNMCRQVYVAAALQRGLEVRESLPDSSEIIAETGRDSPFKALFKLSLVYHTTKGPMAVLKYARSRRPNAPPSPCRRMACSLGNSVADKKAICKNWWACGKHYELGYEAYYEGFFHIFANSLLQMGVCQPARDSAPICLEAICLPVNSCHSGAIRILQRNMYYTDISPDMLVAAADHGAQEMALQVEVRSDRNIFVCGKFNEPPSRTPFGHHVSGTLTQNNNVANPDNSVQIKQMMLHSHSSPPLIPGRWFFAVSGRNLFRTSIYTISVRMIPWHSPEQSHEPNAPVVQPNQNSDPMEIPAHGEQNSDWVMVGEDITTAEGKRESPQVFPARPPPLPKSSLSSEHLAQIERHKFASFSIEDKKEEPVDDNNTEEDFLIMKPQHTQPTSTLLCHSRKSSSSSVSSASSLSMHVPSYFLCPITRQIMREPAVAADGHSYELAAIERWLCEHNRSPLTGAVLPHKFLTLNFALRAMIEGWLSDHGSSLEILYPPGENTPSISRESTPI